MTTSNKKPAVTPAKKVPSRKTVAVVKPATAAPVKVKKPKMVRDSFSMPKTEYAVFETLKSRSIGLGKNVKKTELLRAGIKVLAALTDALFLEAMQGVPSLKTGRPVKEKPAKAPKTV